MNSSFLIKHWIFTLIFGSAFVAFIAPATNGQTFHLWDSFVFFLYILAFSVVFSVPAAALYLLVGYSVTLADMGTLSRKIILTIAAIIGIGVTFAAIDVTTIFTLGVFYSIATIVGSFILKLD